MTASLRTQLCTLYRPEDRGGEGVAEEVQVLAGQRWGRIVETAGAGRVIGERPESRADALILFGADAPELLAAGGLVVAPDGTAYVVRAVLPCGADFQVAADRAAATEHTLVDA